MKRFQARCTDLVPLGAAEPLVIFEDARRAIADARTVDEVKHILAMATGLAAAARKATDREMEAEAEALRMEAERKLGQLMAAQRDTIGFNKGGGDQRSDHRDSKKPSDPLTLAEAGIDKNLAHRARTLAALQKEEFEKVVEAKREAVETQAKTSAANKIVTARIVTPVPISLSFARWLKLFQSGIAAVLPSGYAAWTPKQRDDACEIINRAADEAVAKIRAVDRDRDDDAALPPDTAALVRATRRAKRARAEKAVARRWPPMTRRSRMI
jgi:hypothetical protein